MKKNKFVTRAAIVSVCFIFSNTLFATEYCNGPGTVSVGKIPPKTEITSRLSFESETINSLKRKYKGYELFKDKEDYQIGFDLLERIIGDGENKPCLLYTSPSPRDS